MLKRFFHWVGHLFNSDTAVHYNEKTGHMNCKVCGRDVTFL